MEGNIAQIFLQPKRDMEENIAQVMSIPFDLKKRKTNEMSNVAEDDTDQKSKDDDIPLVLESCAVVPWKQIGRGWHVYGFQFARRPEHYSFQTIRSCECPKTGTPFCGQCGKKVAETKLYAIKRIASSSRSHTGKKFNVVDTTDPIDPNYGPSNTHKDPLYMFHPWDTIECKADTEFPLESMLQHKREMQELLKEETGLLYTKLVVTPCHYGD